MAQQQRQAQRGHALAVAAAHGLGQRQELAFLTAGVARIALDEGARPRTVELGILALGDTLQFGFERGPCGLDAAMLVAQSFGDGQQLPALCIIARPAVRWPEADAALFDAIEQHTEQTATRCVERIAAHIKDTAFIDHVGVRARVGLKRIGYRAHANRWQLGAHSGCP